MLIYLICIINNQNIIIVRNLGKNLNTLNSEKRFNEDLSEVLSYKLHINISYLVLIQDSHLNIRFQYRNPLFKIQ